MRKFTVMIVLFFVLLSGCYRHAYNIGVGAPEGPIVYDSWQHKFIFGLANLDDEAINLEKLCPSGNATVKNRMTFLNGLVMILTSGIYSPSYIKIRCDQARGLPESDQIE